MKKLSSILVCIFCFTSFIFCQSERVNYRKDFDYLYKVLTENSIELAIYTKENNIDLDELFISLKSDLQKDPSLENFLDVLNNYLISQQINIMDLYILHFFVPQFQIMNLKLINSKYAPFLNH